MSWRVWVLIVAGMFVNLVLLALGPGTSWVNSFIQTDAFREEIEDKASTAAGGAVEIQQISFSFASGVKLGGLTSKITSPQGTIVSQVESVNCSFSWLALLERRLQFDGVTLVKPQIVLTQQPPVNVPMPRAGAPAPGNGSGKSAPPPSFYLESASISDGRLSIRDSGGTTKADLQDVKVTADTSGYYDRKEVTAKIAIGTIALPQNLSLTDFTSPLSYKAGAVDAGPFEATAFGGTLTGGYQVAADGSPSKLQLNGEKIEVEKIGGMAHPGAPSPLSGQLAMQSDWQGVETGQLSGEGDAQITHGKLSGVSALHEMAGMLQVPALADPDLTNVTVHFQVSGGTTHFSQLHISSPTFEITGEGVIDARGGLNANLNLTLHGSAMGGVTGGVAALISRAGSIPLHMSGTVSDPHTNLSGSFFNPAPKVDKALGHVVSHLFH